MTTHTAVALSVSALDAWDDVTVHVTFQTSAPLTQTEVVVAPDPVDDACLLQLIDAAISRLIAYRLAYRAAEAEDAAPTPLPMPWYAWGR